MNTRIVDLNALATPSSGNNVLLIIDTSDFTLSPQGTDKKISITNIAAYLASLTQTFTNKTIDTAGTGNVFKINGTAISAITGTGSVVLATSPTLVTPALGVATATSINGVTIPSATDTAALLAASQTFTNKTIVATNNTISALAASMFSTGQVLRNMSNAQNYAWQLGTATATFAASNPATTTVTFGTAFATACDLVLIQPKGTSTNAVSKYISNAYSLTTSGCTVETQYLSGATTDTVTLGYIAIGH